MSYGAIMLAMELPVPPFFSDGLAPDPAYNNIRDDSYFVDCKAYVEGLWEQFHPYADRDFPEDARIHFLQRFWEMYLGVTLDNRDFKLTNDHIAGPEFSVQVDGRRTWFEAVAPTSGDGKDCVPEPVSGELREIPVEKILLRFTNAFDEKKRCYLAAVKKGIIGPHEPYILAINSRGIRDAPDEDDAVPYLIQAFLPFGRLMVAFDQGSSGVADSFCQYRPKVMKESGAGVSTSIFLKPEGAFCSAVIHSTVDCVNHPPSLGEDFAILHNPKATNPIAKSVFPWCTQFTFHSDNGIGRIERTEPAVTSGGTAC